MELIKDIFVNPVHVIKFCDQLALREPGWATSNRYKKLQEIWVTAVVAIGLCGQGRICWVRRGDSEPDDCVGFRNQPPIGNVIRDEFFRFQIKQRHRRDPSTLEELVRKSVTHYGAEPDLTLIFYIPGGEKIDFASLGDVIVNSGHRLGAIWVYARLNEYGRSFVATCLFPKLWFRVIPNEIPKWLDWAPSFTSRGGKPTNDNDYSINTEGLIVRTAG
jgi:hypothetical protein